MTVIATLSQNGNSVDLPLLGEPADILMAVDYGKPHLIEHDTGGTPFARIQDQWSGNQNFNLLGYFSGDSAHQDAIDLAELVHSDGNGDPMVLDIPDLDELESDISVAPSAEQARALNLSYPNGRKNYVEFDLGLTRIDTVLGSYERTVNTPTAAGSGPITISNGSSSVELINDIVVDRYIGRPNDVIRKNQSQYPRYEVKRKIVNDEFELSLVYTDDAASKTTQIANIFSQQTERSGLTLNFNGIYGMGEFTVIPSGGSALRHVRDAGKEGISILPQINLKRIST